MFEEEQRTICEVTEHVHTCTHMCTHICTCATYTQSGITLTNHICMTLLGGHDWIGLPLAVCRVSSGTAMKQQHQVIEGSCMNSSPVGRVRLQETQEIGSLKGR